MVKTQLSKLSVECERLQFAKQEAARVLGAGDAMNRFQANIADRLEALQRCWEVL
jgi:hypothetical protein